MISITLPRNDESASQPSSSFSVSSEFASAYATEPQQLSEDKKSRKKEQINSASARFRKKKKLENEIALTEERDLSNIHAELLNTYSDVQRQIKDVKRLLRDLYKWM